MRAVPLTLFVFLFYVPLGYYTDHFVYRRRREDGGEEKAGSERKKAA